MLKLKYKVNFLIQIKLQMKFKINFQGGYKHYFFKS